MREQHSGNEVDQELLKRLDDTLRERAAERSELPWLELSVRAELEARERAKRWLADHGSLFGPARESLRDELGVTGRGPFAALARSVVSVAGVLGNTRLWTVLGSITAGAVAGWLLGTYLPALAAFDPAALPGFIPAASLALMFAGIGAALGGLASQWQYMWEYYS